MLKFKDYLEENSSNILIEEREHALLPQNLHDFLFHLSSPSDPHSWFGNDLKEEAKVVSSWRAKPSKNPDLMIQKGNEELEKVNLHKTNLHKRMNEKMKETLAQMKTETPEESKTRLKISQEIFNKFASDRGYSSDIELTNKNAKIKKLDKNIMASNTKMQKNKKENYLSKGINLAPHSTNGFNEFDVCPKASSHCRENCLGKRAGGNRYPRALAAKIMRTHFLALHPEHAIRLMDNEIEMHKNLAKKKGMTPSIRLNVTSDFSWEHHARDLFDRHKDVQFYDYTKLPNRVGHKNLPKNYHLTLSHTGTGHAESNDADVISTLERGHGVSMVYQRGKKSPTHVEDVRTGKRYPVVDGDSDDMTFLRHKQAGKTEGTPGHGVVSGLKLKGVKNEAVGPFANKVDDDGIIRINR